MSVAVERPLASLKVFTDDWRARRCDDNALGVTRNAFVLWHFIGGRIPAPSIMFQFALYSARGNRLERVLFGALCNMGNFRLYVGLTDHSNGSHSLDEVGVQPFENARIRLALHSNFRCGNLLCATDVSLST